MKLKHLHEAPKPIIPFRVRLESPGYDPIDASIPARDINDVIKIVKRRVSADPKTKKTEIRVNNTPTGALITFWNRGVQMKDALVTISTS